MIEPKCRICGRGLHTKTPYIPDPLLPGDLPADDELCPLCRRVTAGEAMKWTRNRLTGDYDSHPYVIERLWAPKDGRCWYAYSDELPWDGGAFGRLADAKAACQYHATVQGCR